MKSGTLKHRIIIERPTLSAPNDIGERLPGWSEYARVSAAIEPVSGKEFEFGKSIDSIISHKITIRYVKGLLDTFRIKKIGSVGRLLSINTILNPEELNKQLIIYCTEAPITQGAA